VQKLAVFTYRSPHFCFPWGCRYDYHAICCTDGKTIQCLPNPLQHVPIYLEYLPSYTMLKSMRKSNNRNFLPHFCFPWGRPWGNHAKCCMHGKRIRCLLLTNCLAACARLTITVSEIERDIGGKSSFFHNPLHSTPSLGGVPVGLAPPCFVRKNWNGVATRWWKNFEDIFIHFAATHERDRQTDRHCVPAIATLCIASHGKNVMFAGVLGQYYFRTY